MSPIVRSTVNPSAGAPTQIDVVVTTEISSRPMLCVNFDIFFHDFKLSCFMDDSDSGESHSNVATGSVRSAADAYEDVEDDNDSHIEDEAVNRPINEDLADENEHGKFS